jgi:HPt (histidine-containing phosphotransfer) domain-containing protein
MPSIPHAQIRVPSGPIDWRHLNEATAGDESLAVEVLGLFRHQARTLLDSLADATADLRRVAHTMKGSARSVGAWRVAQSAEIVETAIRAGLDPSPAIDELARQVELLIAAIPQRESAPPRLASADEPL